ncbi:MAG: type II secretion system F family protein, partial [Planktomarina sp.]|nr:type II secretion system F family protein [Planktomarina sp.]
MAKYYYTAQTPDGPVSGLMDATSKRLILKELSNKGYVVTELKRARKFGKKAFWNFIESLHALIDQNTTMAEALTLLAAQNNRTIRKISYQINSALSEGTDFLDALETVFYDLDLAIISLLRVGYENAGLERSLSQIIIAKSQKDELIHDTQKAVAYPAFVLVISLFVLIIIFDNVLPEFKTLISEDSQIGLTGLILSFSGKGYDTLLYIFWSSIGVLFLFAILRSTEVTRLRFEKILNFVPILGPFLRIKTKLSFLENISLALTLKSDLKQALRFSVKAVSNRYHQVLLFRLEQEILEGTSFEVALTRTGLFGQMELLRIGLAEKSARLPATFETLYKSNIANRQKWVNLVIQLLGPLAIIVLGLIIFFVAFAVVTPMMSLQQSVG